MIAAINLLASLQYTSAQLLDQHAFIPIIVTSGNASSCPHEQQRSNALQTLRLTISSVLLAFEPPNGLAQCGAGQWIRIAHLDMTDPFQSCPSTWSEMTTSEVRVCGRPQTSSGMCHGTFYSSGGRTYTKVCGRVIGYQVGHTDAFHSSSSIDSPYVEGVSITYGSPRMHIWTLAADLSETGDSSCPCDSGSTNSPPSFVGNNYYCESGNPDPTSIDFHLYANDPLWDGQLCSYEGSCCSNGRNPPWFSVDIINPTTASIEVRICSDFDTSEDTPIQLLELYIQWTLTYC